MRKILILALALWTGSSNFAYASAKIECADMMKSMSKSSDSCCPENVPCQCSVEDRARDQSAPNTDGQIISRPTVSTAFLSEAAAPAVLADFFSESNESPPIRAPLYQLFSAYRI